ncbi:MAG: DUF563 domain-containing protein [Gemmatimonadaceae bacterium]|nr:DUF563 domain-containing protein [Gemmatimonadaceae bacterium]
MTAVPAYHTPPGLEATPSDALIAFAEALVAAGRIAEAEGALRDAITISPDHVAAYRALSLLLMGAGRDIEVFSTCGTMLARAGRADGDTLRLAADVLLFLHIRHATLFRRRSEPTRLDLRSIGVPDVTPMVLASEYLPRARALALAAVAQSPDDVTAQCALAECELRAGHATAARHAAERAVACEPTRGAMMARALATFADHQEQAALDLLRQPQLSELVPALGTGRQLTARLDLDGAPETVAGDTDRRESTLAYTVHHGGGVHTREVTIRTAPPLVRTIPGGRVVGDLFLVLDRSDRAYVHGLVDEPEVEFDTPRCHDIPAVLACGRNSVLWVGRDGRLLLHSPTAERVRGGRAFLLATNASANYYHWIADALGRLSAAPEVLRDPDVRFVVPTPLLPFQLETMAWLGITRDQVVQVGADEIVEFDELMVVAHRKDGGCTDASVWGWLHAHLTIPTVSTPPAPTRHLFLRGDTGSREPFLNVDEAEAICSAHGFESVDTSKLTVAQRRDLMSEAAMVVSPLGAGLADLLFVPPGARTILFGQRSLMVPCYHALGHAMGHSVRYVLGTEEQSRFVYPHWDYRIDPRELLTALREELGERAPRA